jgi:hypothetical protein
MIMSIRISKDVAWHIKRKVTKQLTKKCRIKNNSNHTDSSPDCKETLITLEVLTCTAPVALLIKATLGPHGTKQCEVQRALRTARMYGERVHLNGKHLVELLKPGRLGSLIAHPALAGRRILGSSVAAAFDAGWWGRSKVWGVLALLPPDATAAAAEWAEGRSPDLSILTFSGSSLSEKS